MAVTEHQVGYLKWPHTQAPKTSASKVAGPFIHKGVELGALEQQGQNICKATAYHKQSNKCQKGMGDREAVHPSRHLSACTEGTTDRLSWHSPE